VNGVKSPFFGCEVFDKIEQSIAPDAEIEITVVDSRVDFSWNSQVIQVLAQALGETEFPEARPCG
jgi:hypothetical protein